MISRARELLIGRLRHRKTRVREGLYLVEGRRAANTVLESGAATRFACLSAAIPAEVQLRARLREAGVEIVEVDDQTLSELSDTRTPQGVLLICEQPRHRCEDLELTSASRVLLLDAVQDPGNAGTLIRAAAAFGVDAVIALNGTVDPWNPKAVRASAGQVAMLPVLAAGWTEAHSALAAASVPVLAADVDGVDIRAAIPASGWALAIGNEGAGVREAILAIAGARVAVPMHDDVDSLNAGLAGAILMYDLCRATPTRPPR